MMTELGQGGFGEGSGEWSRFHQMGKGISSQGNSLCKDLKVSKIFRSPRGRGGIGAREVCWASFSGVRIPSSVRESHPGVW